MFRTATTVCFALFSFFLFAQMPDEGGSVRYGNEWIDYEKAYLAVRVAEDGMYRISAQALNAAGINGSALEVIHEGNQVPFELIGGDLVFMGTKNRGKMDRYLFPNPDEEQLNDRFSMHADTATYFVSAGNNGLLFAAANVSNAVPTDRLLRQTERVFSDHYTKNFFRSSGASIYYSRYDKAEGFGSLSSGNLLSEDGNTTSETLLELPAAIAGSGATLDLRFGTAFGNHNIAIMADGNTLLTTTRSGWNVERHRLPFSISGEATTIRLQGSQTGQDKANLAWMRVTYPAATVYDDQLSTFLLPASGTPTRVVLTGLGAAAGAGEVVKAYAPALNLVTSGQVDAGGNVVLDFPASPTMQTWQLVVNGTYRTATTAPLSFATALPVSDRTNYLLLTSRRLNGPAVRELANYRRSSAGGGYVVQVVNVEDLYDEFGYGIPRHPMAVRNYLAAARVAAPQLQYLFLVGKGREFADLRSNEQLTNAEATFFVPSFGFPASDNLLSAELDSPIPQLSTGRLSAINNNEIAIYARKLRDVEAQINQGGQTIAERDWMKQVMHLGGGGTAGEQSSIKFRLARMTDSIALTTMAPNVTSFFKTSTEPIEDSRQAAIFDRINGGTSILTFMGHSSSQTFDFSIDDPENYENFGRYPFMVSLGCYSGDAFTEARSISERFIFLDNKGAIAFAASKGVGYISALGQWGTELYLKLGRDTYGQGIGDAMRESIRSFSSTSNFTLAILLEQFALSGDPAYRLHPRPGVDLVVDPASVSFEPEVVPAQDLDFTVNLRLLNLGSKPTQDSITLRFRQELPNGTTVALATRRVATPDYDETYQLELPNVGFEAVGQNRVLISVDQDNDIDELPLPEAETNNEVVSGGREGIPLTVVANTARVAFPPAYAVIGGELEFISSTTDGLAPARNYTIQVARDRRFRQLVVNEVINSPGGVIRYSPPFAPVDSTTYYWRISPDSTETEGSGYIWSESSFTWVADRAVTDLGWAVQDPGQLVDGSFINIVADTTIVGWQFSKTATDIVISNTPYRSSIMPKLERAGQILAAPFPWLVQTGMTFYIFDSTNLFNVYRNPGGGVYNTPNSAIRAWTFNTTTLAGRSGMVDFMNNGIPNGKFVYVYSVQRGNNLEYYNEDWERDSLEYGSSIFQALEQAGALEARAIAQERSVPYIFAYQKGMGAIGEVVARNQMDTVILRTTLLTNWPEGEWSSQKAGPALGWKKMSFDLASLNLEQADSVRIQLIGYKVDGSSEILTDEEIKVPETTTYRQELNQIAASDFPFLQARLLFYDEDLRSAPTVSNLFFDFDRPGDVAVNPQIAFTQVDSIVQGQPLELTFGYENISRIPMDSILVKLSVVNDQNEEISDSKRMPPIASNGQDQVSFSLRSLNLRGNIRYQLELNPAQDQPEEVIFNNFLSSKVAVGRDVISPDLKVFFDGRQITDGELISGDSEILIQLRDENPYLPLNDTADFGLLLRYPSGRQANLRFNSPEVEFRPATGQDNMAEILLRPTLNEDGEYTLSVVAGDRSNNSAGRIEFRQDFEVINKQSVSNVLTYPNPFSTSTQFVYTLTGNELPDVFRVQIMTISGRVVRDIDLLANEDIKIGTHRTNYTWDGTDEYGDLLANGVYLYRVLTSNNGDSIEKYEADTTGRFFQNDLGKVVIIR